MLFSNSICHMLFFQADRMPDHKIWLYLSGISCEGQPLPSERAWLDLQSSRRGRSKTIRAAKTGNSQVGRGLLIHLISNKIYQNVRLKWLLMITYAISKLIWLGYIYFLKVIKAKKKNHNGLIEDTYMTTTGRDFRHIFFKCVKMFDCSKGENEPQFDLNELNNAL